MNKKQKKMLIRIAITAVMLIALAFLPLTGIWRLLAYVAAYLVIGYDILRKAGIGIIHGRAFDECFLMAIATLGAFFLAVWTKSGDYVEGISVMLFYQIGELFQSYAVGKSRRNISALMDIRPDYANIEKDGKLEQVDPDEVTVGSIIVVQPGEKVPLDGVVVSGNSTLNTSALTGESLPRDVAEGDEIISGCINMSGVLKIRTTKAFGESTVSKILDLVENASSRKSRSEAFISRFARIYTPAVCIGAVLLGVAVPLLRMAFGADAQWVDWVYRALTFLVVSCPCALVISIPLSFFAGIGGASKEGILIKGSNYLEALAATKVVVFDKTGTLTQGVFEVTAVHHNELDADKVLEYAALAECASSHPISKSLQKAYGKPIDRSRVTNVEEISGHGITATVDGHSVAAGNAKLMKKLGIDYHDCHCVGTIIHMAVDGAYAGHIVISDIVKPHSAEAIARLKKSGVSKTVMLTGDARRVAEQVAGELGVDEVRSELLPGDKVAEVEKLLAEKSPKDQPRLCRRRHQRRTRSDPRGHRHRHGCHGQRRRHRSRRRCADGRRSPADRQGHPHLAQVHRHRAAEHRVLPHREICLPCPDGRRYHEHVGRHLRRRRRDDPRRAQRHPRPARPQSLSWNDPEKIPGLLRFWQQVRMLFTGYFKAAPS